KYTLFLHICITFAFGVPSSEIFEEDCNYYGGSVQGNRCFSNGAPDFTPIGVDLSNSLITVLPDDIFSSSLQFLYLHGNPELEPLESLCGGISLNKLLLDSSQSCPGQDVSWNSTKVMFNSTIRVCKDQQNFCETFTKKGNSCPNNSKCVFSGPGCLNCVCKSGYWGYRCLLHGHFPTLVFSIAAFLSFSFICIAFYCRSGNTRAIGYGSLPSDEI
ncbi:unnamed protein product, partial [Hymenolepis diminuta]